MARRNALCADDCPGHEWTLEREEADDTDLAVFLCTVTGPPEPARVNPPLECCAGCAGNLATAYSGFGWTCATTFIDGTTYQESLAAARDLYHEQEAV